MTAFAQGEIDALVTTTVIEVGVDVPNATLMVIENAERFGLTQLHQLRGRVGRGRERSVCVLVPTPGTGTTGARARCASSPGPSTASRSPRRTCGCAGPGELWGTRQSGLPRLKLADLVRDHALLEQAVVAARGLVEADPWLMRPAHAALRGAAARELPRADRARARRLTEHRA